MGLHAVGDKGLELFPLGAVEVLKSLEADDHRFFALIFEAGGFDAFEVFFWTESLMLFDVV